MRDYLDILAADAKKSIDEGYYETLRRVVFSQLSLRDAIVKSKHAAVISEIKFSSPSKGSLRKYGNLKKIAQEIQLGGAVGISMLTEPKHFEGNLEFIADVREEVTIPILMKDIIISPLQIDAGSSVGANAILLIQTLFERSYAERSIGEMVKYAHSKGLEVLLESHTGEEFVSALGTDADMLGINNRNLKTFEVDLGVTRAILTKYLGSDRIVVSESGINSAIDIRFLGQCGAKAFLVGTAIMKAHNIKDKVKELVEAI
jgi:indole-3-glycerol phosphate synthase